VPCFLDGTGSAAISALGGDIGDLGFGLSEGRVKLLIGAASRISRSCQPLTSTPVQAIEVRRSARLPRSR